MSDLERVFARLADDAGFADAVRLDPLDALRPYDLSADDLRRIEAALTRPIAFDTLLGRPDPS